MISPRYTVAACVLIAVALVPTFIHSYSPAVADDGRSAGAVPQDLAGYSGVASQRAATWGKRRFDSDDWMERAYVNASGERLTLTVVRTFDAKAVYHHPELAVSYPRVGFAGHEVKRFARRPDVPVHVLKPAAGRAAIGMYVLQFDTRLIDDPLLFQIRAAAEMLFSRRKAMTLFFVLDEQADDPQNLEQSSALTLLLAAIDAFAGQAPRAE